MKMIKLFFLSMFLAPVVFSMDAKENVSASKPTIYAHFLNGISDNPKLKTDLANVLSFLLNDDALGDIFDDEKLIEQILEYCKREIVEHKFRNFPFLDGDSRDNNIKLLSHDERKKLIKLIIMKILNLLSDEAQNRLASLLSPIRTNKSKPSGQEIIRKHEKKRLKLLRIKTKQLFDTTHDGHRLKYWLASAVSAMLMEKGKNLLNDKELVEEFLEFYSSLIIKYGLQKYAFHNDDPEGIEIELLPVRGKRAIAKTIMRKVWHLLAPFAFSMHTYEEPIGGLRLHELDSKAYNRLREKTDSLLDKISDDHALKLSLVNVATVLLTLKNFKNLLDDEKSVELFLRQYHENIVKYLLHKQASLDGDPRIIIDLNFQQKQNLTELIILKIEHLLSTH